MALPEDGAAELEDALLDEDELEAEPEEDDPDPELGAADEEEAGLVIQATKAVSLSHFQYFCPGVVPAPILGCKVFLMSSIF